MAQKDIKLSKRENWLQVVRMSLKHLNTFQSVKKVTCMLTSLYRCSQSVSVCHCVGHTFEQLAAHWCMGGGFVSAVCAPPPVLSPPSPSIPLISALSILIKLGTCFPNNLPPRSPGTTPAFHQHHCFSAIPPLVLPHHGNTLTHPLFLAIPSVDRPAMCLFIRLPAATPLYAESTWCRPFVWVSVLSYLPLTSGSLHTITWVLVATGYPHWPVIDEPINGVWVCVVCLRVHMCVVAIQPL